MTWVVAALFVWSLFGRKSYRTVVVRMYEFVSGRSWGSGSAEWEAYYDGLIKAAPSIYGILLVIQLFFT